MEKWLKLKKDAFTDTFTAHVLPENMGVIGAIECLLWEKEILPPFQLEIATGNGKIKDKEVTDENEINEIINWLENIEASEEEKLKAAKIKNVVTNEEINIVTKKEFF